MKFKIVDEKTGQPVGFGMSFCVRSSPGWLPGYASASFGSSAILFPLWDPKRQTLVDKI